MAELTRYSDHQSAIAELRARGVADDDIIASLRSRSETIVIQCESPRRFDVRWIVGGAVLSVAMLISLFWSVFLQFMAVLETAYQRHHELAVSAISAVKVAEEKSGGGDVFVWGLVAAALVCFLLGLGRLAK